MSLKKQLETRKRLGVKYVRVRRAAPATKEAPKAVSIPAKRTAPAPASGTKGSPEPVWCLGNGPKADELRVFRDEIKGCLKCPLGKTRKNFVFGVGNPDARVLFIGEAPGADEDAQGLAFVGRAGQLLTKIIASTKTWKREDVFIGNVLKCRPPNNRPPQPDEVERCLPYLKKQIAIIRPVLIMAMGASAAQALLSTKMAVGKLRNQWHDFEGTPLLVTYHPAALLRTDAYKRDVWEDMKRFTARYKELTG